MNFLNPFFLIGSLALAVPVLIHLVRREKTEIVPFSTLMFLLRVPKRAIRQQKIKNLLLMALRLLLLALLVGSFARPYLTQQATQAVSSSSNRAVVLMLDNSYSMRYGDNFSRLKSEATKRIDALGAGDRMALIAFNDNATLLTTPTGDKTALKAALSALEPSYGGTRFYEAFSMADRAFSQMALTQKSLILISDFQRSGWNRSSHENVIGNDVKTETVDLGVENPSNVGIDSVGVDETSFTRTYAGRVIARVHNHSKDKPVTVPVSLSLNEKEIERKSVTIPANSTALVEYTGFDLNLNYNKGRIRVEAKDPLDVDNDFIFTLERREKLKLLIVDTGRPKQSLYLQQVYNSSLDLPFETRTVSVNNLSANELGNHEVVVINDVPRLPDAIRDRLNELRKSGQGQIVILGTNADVGWWNSYASFPLKITQKIYVEKDRGKYAYALTTYDRNHAIFKSFEKSSTLTLSSAQFYAYVEGQAKKGAGVLAKYENGSPAIVESPKEDRGMIVFTSGMDGNIQNDLPLKPAFLPLLHETVRYLTRYSENRGWYAMGEAIPVVGTIDASAAAVIDPKGERLALGDLAAGEQKFFTPEAPGYHEIRVGRDIRVVAVNPPSAEGNLDRMPPEDLLASVKRSAGDTQQAGFFSDDSKTDYARKQTGWWYLLLFALLAGIAEIYLANRSYSRS
jgi:Mg-chelatase subunit ChlD